MKFEVVPRKCSTCIRKGKCKDQKRFEVSPTGRCSRQHVSRRAIEVEIVRLKIAHLWRVVEVIHFKYRAGLCKRHQTNRIDKLQSACLAKIAELKESQCSTKP